jgi:hypothetical protein
MIFLGWFVFVFPRLEMWQLSHEKQMVLWKFVLQCRFPTFFLAISDPISDSYRQTQMSDHMSPWIFSIRWGGRFADPCWTRFWDLEVNRGLILRSSSHIWFDWKVVEWHVIWFSILHSLHRTFLGIFKGRKVRSHFRGCLNPSSPSCDMWYEMKSIVDVLHYLGLPPIVDLWSSQGRNERFVGHFSVGNPHRRYEPHLLAPITNVGGRKWSTWSFDFRLAKFHMLLFLYVLIWSILREVVTFSLATKDPRFHHNCWWFIWSCSTKWPFFTWLDFFKPDGSRRYAPIAVGLSLSENYSTTFRKMRFAWSPLRRSGHRARVHHSIISSKIEIWNGSIHTAEQQWPRRGR